MDLDAYCKNELKETQPRCRIVIWENPRGRYMAQVLEMDIVAQGRSLPEVVDHLAGGLFAYKVLAERNGKDDPFAGIPEAPDYYWDFAGIRREGDV